MTSRPPPAAAIAQHYDTLASSRRLSFRQRRALPTHALRNVQNRIKECLIERCGHRTSVYDACCGRGGDMAKYANHTKPDVVVFADISSESIAEAKRRYQQHGRALESWKVYFHTMNCFAQGPPLPPVLPFTLIVCNMALHYAFETKESAARALRTLAARLDRARGVLLCTLPDARVLARRSRNFTLREFGNEYYTVRFIDMPHSQRRAYRFSLQDAVANCIEYVVTENDLAQACDAANLEIIANESFSSLVARVPHLMRVYGHLSKSMQDVVTLYRACYIRHKK